MRIAREIRKRLGVELAERRRWLKASASARSDVRIFYGYERLPAAGEVASGGIVKTQDLQTMYPNVARSPNLLYLISSALPPYAARMASLAHRSGAKVVLNQNGVAYPGWHGAGWEAANRHMREVLKQADYVFYQSAFCKAGADRFLQERTDRCEILFNAVDTMSFSPATELLPLKPVRLLLAGSHTHFYRVQTAVETVRFLLADGVDVLLEIAGRCCWGTNADVELTQHIREQGLLDHVRFTGPYTQEQACSVFQRAHILLHTKYNDPCPRLVVEAMACGLPIVHSESGGTPELVGNDAGMGVPAPLDWERDRPPSPEKLADAVKRVLQAYEHYSLAARQRAVTVFDSKAWINRHQAVFERLMKGGSLERV